MIDWIKTLGNVVFCAPKDTISMSIKDVGEIRDELMKLTNEIEYRKKEIARLRSENMRLVGKAIELTEAAETVERYKIDKVV